MRSRNLAPNLDRMQATTARALVTPGDGVTMVAPTFVAHPRPDVLALDLEDGVVLYDPNPSLVHHLNPSAAEIWRRCDGRRPVSAIAADLAATYAVRIEQMGEQVRLAVSHLVSLGLLQEASIESALGSDASERRERP